MIMLAQRGVKAGQDTGRLFTIRDIAELAGVSVMTVRRWIDAGDLKIHRLGRLVRISQADLAVFLAGKQEPSKIR